MLTRRVVGQSMAAVCKEMGEYLAGWKAYFRIAETPRIFADADKWVRHRLRALQLKHWKRGPTIYRELRARGMSDHAAIFVDQRFPSRRARKWPNGSSTGSLRHVVCGLFLVLCALPVLLIYSVNDDHCRQHWTEQSGLVASRIDRLVRANRAIAMQAVAERRPIFYCLAGPKSPCLIFVNLRAASTINCLTFSFTVVFAAGAAVCSCFMRTSCGCTHTAIIFGRS